MKKLTSYLILLFFLLFLTFSKNVHAQLDTQQKAEQGRVIANVKMAESYILKHGKEKAIIEFNKRSYAIFMGDYNGMFYLSPLHPELIGSNQFNYKDPTGAFVVQEEIDKAKAGGGWLKGRWRKDPKTGQYVCRKVYILPIPGDYFIGSWYHYPADKPGTCLI